MSDYITGDEMIAMLIAEGGSEAATFSGADDSLAAALAWMKEFVLDGSAPQHPVFGLHIDFIDYDRRGSLRDADYLTREDRLTPKGVAFIDGVVAKYGCTCTAREHRIMESRAALAALEG